MRVALIDLGTNTFSLSVVDVSAPHAWQSVFYGTYPVTLGEGGIAQGIIAEPAMLRAVAALEKMHADGRLFNPGKWMGVATSAIRNASNGTVLMQKSTALFGPVIETISGDREAELIFQAVAATYSGHNPFWVMDIGGGSVEFILGDGTRRMFSKSFEIGAARLRERFHQIDPIPSKTLTQLDGWLRQELAILTSWQNDVHATTLIGAAGTFETLCQLMNIPLPENKSVELPFDDVMRLVAQVTIMPRDERVQLGPLADYRVDMFPTALQLLKTTIEMLEIKKVWASPWSVKEGLLVASR